MHRGDRRRVGRPKNPVPADAEPSAVQRRLRGGQRRLRRGPVRPRTGAAAAAAVRQVRLYRGQVGDAAETVRHHDAGRAGQPEARHHGRQRQGHRAEPGVVQQVPGHAGRFVEHDAVRHGRGTGRAGTAGRGGQTAGGRRGPVDGRGGVQTQRRRTGGGEGGHNAARAEARGGRGQDRRQGVQRARQGRQTGRFVRGDAGRSGRLRRMHQTVQKRPTEKR